MSVEQLSSTEGMTSAEIFEALNEGRLDEYLARPNRTPQADPGPGDADQGARGDGKPEQLTTTSGMSAAEIVEALDAGRLSEYLGRRR